MLRLSPGGQAYGREQLRFPGRKSLATKVQALTDDNSWHDPNITNQCLVEGHLKLGEVVTSRSGTVVRFVSGTDTL